MAKRTASPRVTRKLTDLETRRQEARARRRLAKQQAKEARKLMKEARKVAKRAKAELQVLGKKLKKLLARRPTAIKPATKRKRAKSTTRRKQ